MKRLRPGSGARTLFRIGESYFVFRSEHPQEERIVELTADYEDENGDLIPPEAIAWDGVETHPGMHLGPLD